MGWIVFNSLFGLFYQNKKFVHYDLILTYSCVLFNTWHLSPPHPLSLSLSLCSVSLSCSYPPPYPEQVAKAMCSLHMRNRLSFRDAFDMHAQDLSDPYFQPRYPTLPLLWLLLGKSPTLSLSLHCDYLSTSPFLSFSYLGRIFPIGYYVTCKY